MMGILIPLGGLVTLLGLVGIFWCVIQAWRARRAGLQGEAMTARLKRLALVNMVALLLSAVGLMLVVSGILLG